MSAIYYKGKKYTGPTLDLGSGSLTTNNKTIVGAINELNSSIPDGASFNPVYSSDLNNFDTTYPKVSIYYTDGDTLNTPYKAGLTTGQKGICVSFSTDDGYWTQIFATYAGIGKMYQRYGTPPNQIFGWYEPAFKVSHTVTISVADWSSTTTCTKSVTGVTASNNVIITPAPSSIADWQSAGVYCSAQASNGTLTFTCSSTPTASITVNILIIS